MQNDLQQKERVQEQTQEPSPQPREKKPSLAARVRQAWAKVRQRPSDRQGRQFPESENRLVQLLLFMAGSLPRRASNARDRVLRRRRKNGRLRQIFDDLSLHPAVFLCGALLVAALAVGLSLYTVAVSAQYDGISLGAVSGRRTVEQAVTDLEQVTRDTLSEPDYTVDRSLLQLRRRLIPRKELKSREEFEDALAQRLGKVGYGYMLYINDEPVAATRFSGAIEELLEQMKTSYITADTVECGFDESVEIRQEYVDASYLMNLGYIAERLNDTRAREETYTVASGDAWSLIAERSGMTSKELLALNPGYDIDHIHVGDVLTTTAAVPYLTVRNVERQSYVEDIPYQVEYQDDPTLFEGDYQVISPGQYGKADTTANVTYVNGEERSRQVVATVTLTQPVAEQQLRGTKVRPTWYPTGTFRWPCSGRLTSGFGYRHTGIPGASTYHKGIDIANSYGTAVCASDGGTVSYAGWMSGYGYLIIIDHGNGYETYYGHNSSLVVSVGDHVYQGQVVARMGSTGNSSGNHCHFGIMKDGAFVNPLNYL